MKSGGQNLAAGLPHDIRGLLPYQTPWWHYALAGLAAVVVAGLLAWGIWYLLKKRRSKAREERPVDPWDALESRLGVMLPPGEFPRGIVQENYFYSLSLILREAVELKTGIRATDLTLYELKNPLRRQLPFREEDIEAVIHFLERADMVKFAGAPSQREEALGDHGRVKMWVRELRPRPQPVGGDGSLSGGSIFLSENRRTAEYRAPVGNSAPEGTHVPSEPSSPESSSPGPSNSIASDKETSRTGPSRGRGMT
jgi:hypothetical protein